MVLMVGQKAAAKQKGIIRNGRLLGPNNVGDRVIHNDLVYVCIQTHISQSDRYPGYAISLWRLV